MVNKSTKQKSKQQAQGNQKYSNLQGRDVDYKEGKTKTKPWTDVDKGFHNYVAQYFEGKPTTTMCSHIFLRYRKEKTLNLEPNDMWLFY